MSMDLLWQIIVGGIIGWIASIVMKTNAQMGIIWNIVVGIVGAALAGLLAPKLGIAPEGTLGAILVAIAGAVLVILLLKILRILK